MRSAATRRLLCLLILPASIGCVETRAQTLSSPVNLTPGAALPQASPSAPGTSKAPAEASPAIASDAPVLTLEDAVTEADRKNRQLQVAEIDTNRADNEIAAAKTLLYPNIHLYALGGGVLTRPTIYFNEGALGNEVGGTPIPSQNTTIYFPRHLAGLVFAQANLPLSQRFRINLGIRLLEATKELRRAQERESRHDIANQVKRNYYNLLQVEAQLETAEMSVKLFDEALRVAHHALDAQAVLPADVMEVETRLAQSQLQVEQLRNGRQTLKEQINQLMGRAIDEEFRTQNVAEADAAWGDLAEARRRALASRPEIAQAQARITQASLARRSAAADWMPNVTMSGTYFTTLNLTGVVPANLLVVGLLVDWEPLTWGRRKAETEIKKKVEKEANLGIDEARSRILVEVGADYRALEESRLQLKVSRLSQDTARERLRVAENQFRENASLLKDLLEAQTKASNASSDYAKALSQYWTARANFEKAIGE